MTSLRASNGSGEAVRANVVVARDIGSTEINVDSVLNWPSTFIATSGALVGETFDPETVTVFHGHLNGTFITIDSYAAGYSDIGHAANQIVVIKPTTEWANLVADAAEDTNALTLSGTSLSDLLGALYPVGAVYVSGASTMPALIAGVGTWVRLKGRVIVGVDEAQTEFDTVNETGGAKTHTLTEAQIPSHRHTITSIYDDANYNMGTIPANGQQSIPYDSGTIERTQYTNYTGGGTAHNNLQPYKTKYMWERTV